MKKWIALVLAAVLALGTFVSAGAETFIKPDLDMQVKKPASIENNPAIEGEDPFTGLPVSVDAYTPILEVFDGSEQAYPHWGLSAASVVIEVPNMSMGNNKLLGLFTYEFPSLVGGSRSARMTALPWAMAFNSAFVSAKYGPPEDAGLDDRITVENWLRKWGFRRSGSGDNRTFGDLLGNGDWKERTNLVPSPANLLAHLDEIHAKIAGSDNTFEKRPFLFTDEPLSRGDEATDITLFYDNNAANCRFEYDEDEECYIRWSVQGKASNQPSINYDRNNQKTLEFNNLIVMRWKFFNADGYYYAKDNMVGGGQADIFQNGRHITGSWYRDSETSRVIFLDENGDELRFQRGKTFIAYSGASCKHDSKGNDVYDKDKIYPVVSYE